MSWGSSSRRSYRSNTGKTGFGCAVIIAAVVGASAVTGVTIARADSTAARCQGSDTAATEYTVTGGSTLDGWLHRHHAYLANVLAETANCEGGGWSQSRFVLYLDRQRYATQPLPVGTRLWN